jgi:hypothetical protein
LIWTDNTMAKRYQRGNQTVNWRWTENAMAKRYQWVIKAVNWRWTDNAMTKRYQRGNQKKKDIQRSSKHNTEN